MQLFHDLIDLIRNPGAIIAWGYPGLALVIFLETGALVFFLPGDSLLVTAGLYAGTDKGLSILLLNLILIPCAIIGDATSYMIGKRMGPMLFKRPESRFFKPKHIQAAKEFYERHGGKAIIIARFMPLVRTFVPVVAGAALMPYRRFAAFNVIGGASWVLSMTLLGYLLGAQWPDAGKHIEKVIIVIVFVSILPGIIGWWKNRNKPAVAIGAEPAPATEKSA
ncbi:MAG: DedA protein [Myxococcaceae bacterium]|nr:DedA protein [Myxococcaceae bacterium]